MIPTARRDAAHAATDHPLSLAHSPSYAVTGQVVYVICGWQGCPQRLAVDAARWRAEELRRHEAKASWQAERAEERARRGEDPHG